jgi:hypothetical protein
MKLLFKTCIFSIFFIIVVNTQARSQVVYAKHRVVMVFADANQNLYNNHIKDLKSNKYKKAWKERQTIIYAEMEDKKIDWLQERRKRNIGQNDFAIVLIGKDGGDKMINTEGIEAKDLIKIIDSMPMRKREIK